MKHTTSPIFIFDFDGTLADSMQLTIDIFNQVAGDYNLPQIKKSDIPQIRNSSAKELLNKYKISPWKLAQLIKTIQKMSQEKFDQVQPISGIKEALLQLKKQNIDLGIVTSNTTPSVGYFLKKYDFPEFEFVHAEKNLFGKAKVFKHIIKKYSLNLETSWYLGDEVRDIEAAHQVKLPIISVTWGMNSLARLKQAQPEFIVENPTQINELAATKLNLVHPAGSKSNPA